MNVVKTNKKINSKSVYDTTQKKSLSAILRQTKEENNRIKKTLPTTTGEGENITLSKTAEMEFVKPPLPMGNSTQVQYSGKNLLPPVSATGQTNSPNIGITVDYSTEGYYIVKGTATATNNVLAGPLEKNYIIQENDYLHLFNDAVSNGTVQIVGISSSNTQIFAKTIVSANKIIDLSQYSGSELAKLSFYCVSGLVINMKLTPMIVNNVSTATDFEKYVGGTASPNPTYPQAINNVTGDVEVLVQNKNLWNTVFINSTSAKIRDNERLLVKPNLTYFFNAKTNTSNILNGYFIQYDENLNNIGETNWATLPISITTKSNCKYLRISLKYSSGANISPSEINNIQLEQGSTATTYTPHKEQTFTFPLGTQRMFLGDYLADDGIHHVRKQKVFVGSNDESFNLQSINSNGIANFGIGLSDYSGTDANLSLCDYFSPQQTPIAQTTEEGYYLTASKALYFRIKSTTASTVAELKTWLSTHNTTVEYELATEEITPYTTEQQTAYNEIKQALSYEEQTNISGSSDESNPLFSVEAYQSTKLILENIDSRLTIVES